MVTKKRRGTRSPDPTVRDAEEALRDAEELLDMALNALRSMLPGNQLANRTAAKLRIKQLAEMLEGDRAIQCELRMVQAQARRFVAALHKASNATAAAQEALREMGDLADLAFYDGVSQLAAYPGDDGDIGGDPEHALSSPDRDFLVRALEKSTTWLERALAVAAPARGQGFLAAVRRKAEREGRGKDGPPPATPDADHVQRCAKYVAEHGASHCVAQSPDGPFHRFVNAVAMLVEEKEVSKLFDPGV